MGLKVKQFQKIILFKQNIDMKITLSLFQHIYHLLFALGLTEFENKNLLFHPLPTATAKLLRIEF